MNSKGKRKVSTYFALTICTILLFTSIIGCTGGSKEQTNDVQRTQSSGKSETQSSGKSETQSSGKSESQQLKPLIKYRVLNTSWEKLEGTRILQFLVDKFNVELIPIGVTYAERNQKVRSMISAGDIPDVFLSDGPMSTEYQMFRADDLIMNISPYLPNFPYLNETLNTEEIKFWKDADGNMYGYPRPRHIFEAAGILYRRDWLEKLNLEIPETYDDLKEVLRAFVENKPDGVDTTGITMSGISIIRWEEVSWTGINKWGIKDGRYVRDYIQPEIREAWRYFKSLYDEGLLDNEVFIMSEDTAIDKFVTGRAGAIHINRRNPQLSRVFRTMEEVNPEASIIPQLTALKGPLGQKMLAGDQYQVMTHFKKDMKDPERLLEVMDWMWTEEGIEWVNYGIEGIHYTKGANGEHIMNWDELVKDQTEIKNYAASLVCYPEILYGRMEVQEDKVYAELRENLTPYLVINPVKQYATEVQLNLEKKLDDIYREYRAKFISGELDLDKDWDQYIKALTDAGYQEYEDDLNEFMKKHK